MPRQMKSIQLVMWSTGCHLWFGHLWFGIIDSAIPVGKCDAARPIHATAPFILIRDRIGLAGELPLHPADSMSKGRACLISRASLERSLER